MDPNDRHEHPGKDDPERDHRAGNLVSEYLDRLNRGEKLNPLQILAEHPDVGGEVLKDLETLLARHPALSRAVLRLEAQRLRILLTAIEQYSTQSL